MLEAHSKLLQLWIDHGLTVSGLRVFVVVVLVIGFGGVKCIERAHFGDHFGIERFPVFFDNVFRNLAFFIGAKIDHASILRADVGSLSIGRGRVVSAEMHPHEVFVRNFFLVVGYLNHFSVTGVARGYFPIGWIDHIAAAVAAFDVVDAVEVLKNRFRAPETAAAKGRQSFSGFNFLK
jgi:hypothetical protein